MMLKNYRSLAIAIIINAITFAIFFLLLHPIYNSIEDAYILYVYSGGFGNTPTEMAHYNYGLHPILGWIIKSLFELNNQINWYSLAIISSHFVLCTIVLNHVIKYRNNLVSYAVYAGLFIVFEGYFLLLPDFTGGSIALTIAGFLYLLLKIKDGQLAFRHCVITAILFLFASFFRMHSMVPIVGIALPFLVWATTKGLRIRVSSVLLASLLLIFIFNFLHKAYYTSKKTDWPQEEAYRQKLFRFYNESAALKIPEKGQKWYLEYQAITAGAILDTTYLPSSLIDSVYRDIKQVKPKSSAISSEWAKWFWINNRLFFALAIVLFIIYGIQKQNRFPLLISLFLLAAGCFYLLAKAKLPPFIFISGLSFICFAVFLNGNESFPEHKYHLYKLLAAGGISLFTLWGLVRLYKFSQQNEAETYNFKQQYAEIASHQNKLFICLGDFELKKFYAFDNASKYPLHNLLFTENFISNSYQAAFTKFHINSVKDLLSSPNVYFWGKPSDGLKYYLERLTGESLAASEPLVEFKTGQVWHLRTF